MFVIQYRLKVLTPRDEAIPRLCRRKWSRTTEVCKFFSLGKTEVQFVVGNFAAREKTRLAAGKNNDLLVL